MIGEEEVAGRPCNGKTDCPAETHIDGCLGDPNGNHYRPRQEPAEWYERAHLDHP